MHDFAALEGQWMHFCPRCGEDALHVVSAMTVAGQLEMNSPLEPNGFEVPLPVHVKDQPTEDEVVRCSSCGRQYDLCQLSVPDMTTIEHRIEDGKIVLSYSEFQRIQETNQAAADYLCWIGVKRDGTLQPPPMDGGSYDPTSARYMRIGTAVGALVDRKNAQYGDSFNRSGEILRVLFPNGVAPSQYEDMLCLVRIIDKMFRIATAKDGVDPGGESPYRDIAGYGLLGTYRSEAAHGV